MREIPVLREIAGFIYAKALALRFRGSQHYWKQRYAKGGTAGSGSCGRRSLRGLRREIQLGRTVRLKEWLRPFHWAPYKLGMFFKYGLPDVRLQEIHMASKLKTILGFQQQNAANGQSFVEFFIYTKALLPLYGILELP